MASALGLRLGFGIWGHLALFVDRGLARSSMLAIRKECDSTFSDDIECGVGCRANVRLQCECVRVSVSVSVNVSVMWAV